MKKLFLLTLLTLSVGVYAQQPPGAATALDFNGSGDDVSIKDNKMLNPTEAITVEAWINPESFGKNFYDNSIFCKHNWAKGNKGYVLRCGDGGKVSFNLSFNGVWKEAVSSAVLSTYEWAHVVGVFDGDTIRVYVNGIQQATFAQSGSIDVSSGFPAKIGEISDGSNRNFDGQIDEVRVWDTCLTEKAIRDYMCRKVDNSHPFYGHLAALYNLDENKGSTAYDLGQGGSNGAINGPKWTRSGAPLGDKVAYNYNGTTVGMVGALGDSVHINNITGKPDGVHLYYVGDTTDAKATTGVTVDFDSSHYWGVYVAGGSGSTFNLNYNYKGYSGVTSSNECDIDLFTKSGPDAVQWNSFSAKSHFANDSLTRSASKPGEFILGYFGSNRKLVSSTGDSVACMGDKFELYAPGNSTFTYRWYKDGKQIANATSGVLSLSTSGVYKAYVERDKNCYFTTDEMTVKFNASPTTNLPQPKGICESEDTLWLSGASPAGGVFYGKGLGKDSLFMPSSVQAGKYEIRYEYTDKSGCTGRDTINIEVFALPKVSFKSTQGMCNNLDSVVLTEGQPSGGTYSGNGIWRNQFFPDSVSKSTGIFPLKYEYTDGNGCSNSANYNIKLLGATPISFPATDTVCENGGLLNLKGSPSGGAYTGNGVSGKELDPQKAGVGQHYVTYTFSNIDNCVSVDSHLVVVNGKPTAGFSGDDSVCVNGTALSLTKGTPAGGMYIGTGVINSNQFDPTAGVVGNNVVSYVYTNTSGCSDTASSNIKIMDTTQLSVAPINGICENGNKVSLAAVSPVGGNYSGVGVSGNQFDPTAAGKGFHNLVYVYTDASNCVSKTTLDIEVFGLGMAKVTVQPEICLNADSIQVINVSPAGGTLSGFGMNGDYFNPSVAGAGKHAITYSALDSNGCSISSDAEITVNDLPVVTLSFDNSVCTEDPTITLSGGAPTGGEYEVEGFATTVFSPKGRGVGDFDIKYTYTDGKGCTNETTKVLYVNATPDKPTIDGDTSSLTSSATSGNQWYNSQGAISGATDQVYEPSVKGYYYVVVTSDSGCTAMSDSVFFENLGLPGLPENAVKLYPNPVHNQLVVQTVGLETAQLRIYNANGAVVFDNWVKEKTEVTTVQWPSGVYFVHITTAQGNAIKKVIKN